MEDSHYKGLIDLAEVQSVTPAPSAAVGTKKVDERAFFDVSYYWGGEMKGFPELINRLFPLQLKTSRRTYNFYAGNATRAQEWIEKIQACLQ